MNRWLFFTHLRNSPSSLYGTSRADAWLTDVPLAVAVGDEVVLWRRRCCAGVVGVGTIADLSPGYDPLHGLLEPPGKTDTPTHQRARIDFSTLALSAAVTPDILRSKGLSEVADSGKRARTDNDRTYVAPEPLVVADPEWLTLLRLVDEPAPPTEWPGAWHIPAGTAVKRSQVHQVYGGNTRIRQSRCARTPNLLIFLDGESTRDIESLRRRDGTMTVAGSPEITGYHSEENLAVIDHINRGTALRLFRFERRMCVYLGEFRIARHGPAVDRWDKISEKSGQGAPHPSVEDRSIPFFRLEPLDVQHDLRQIDTPTNAPQIELALNQVVTIGERGNRRRFAELQNDKSNEKSIRHLRAILAGDADSADALSSLDIADDLATLIQYRRRRTGLAELRSIVEDPKSREADIQKVLAQMPWVFGGQFLSQTARRALTSKDELDLSLIRPDGSLHGVELKKANIEKFARRHRNHAIVGACVNEAVGQAVNYLRSLDEQRHQILADLGIDCRRASITVVIGHTAFASANLSRAEILETIRTYNSHLSRVTVITYDSLIDAAERSLMLSEGT